MYEVKVGDVELVGDVMVMVGVVFALKLIRVLMGNDRVFYLGVVLVQDLLIWLRKKQIWDVGVF